MVGEAARTEAVTECLARAVDALGHVDVAVVGQPDALVALDREIERLLAMRCRATARFDAERAWQADGARTGAAWLGARCRLPAKVARRRTWLARVLRRMPLTEAAWLAGAINEHHVSILAKAASRAPEAFARDESLLVRKATELKFGEFSRLGAYWLSCADPDGSDGEADKQRDARRLHLSKSLGGMWFLDGAFDPLSGEAVANVLRAIEDELFRAEWSDAKARLGEGATVTLADLARTPAQRRADALVEMARRAAAMPAAARKPAPLFSVLVDCRCEPQPLYELGSGTVVSARSLIPWLDDAEFERIVFDGANRVIDVGRRQRLFRGAARRAVQVRDRSCAHPYCDEPAERCQIDHIRRWADGGTTDPTNGRPSCAFHNRLREKEFRRRRE